MLDPNGDYTFGQNQNGLYGGTDAVAQAIYTSLKLLAGEWWEDTSIGFPLFQHVIGSPGTPEQKTAADMLVQEAILGVANVQTISAFASTLASRTYAFSATIQTTFGELGLQEVALGP